MSVQLWSLLSLYLDCVCNTKPWGGCSNGRLSYLWIVQVLIEFLPSVSVPFKTIVLITLACGIRLPVVASSNSLCSFKTPNTYLIDINKSESISLTVLILSTLYLVKDFLV